LGLYIGISNRLKGNNTIAMIILVALGGVISELTDVDSDLKVWGKILINIK
jgi:uncharacterized membrane protein YqgA involved in biofilm formation